MKEPKSLKDAFNENNPSSPYTNILRTHNGVTYIFYDFAQRVVLTSGTGGYAITPFSQMDRDTLILARDKLVELGGNPPELPAEAPSAQPRRPGALNP